MADLLSKEMIADLIINLINIAVLFFVTRKLLYKPVKKVLAERKEKATEELNKAREQTEQALELKARYEKALSSMDEKNEQSVRHAEEQAKKAAERIVEDAQKKADTILKNAQTEAQKQRQSVLSENKQQISDAVVKLSSEILLREVSDADNVSIINAFFGKE